MALRTPRSLNLRPLILGQLIAALTGVTAYKLLGSHIGLAASVAVATTIVFMQLTSVVHPPAGATALIAVLGPAQVHHLGYQFVLSPVLVGALILLVVAVIVNNFLRTRTATIPSPGGEVGRTATSPHSEAVSPGLSEIAHPSPAGFGSPRMPAPATEGTLPASSLCVTPRGLPPLLYLTRSVRVHTCPP